MKKQLNHHPFYKRKDKSLKQICNRIPPKAFRQDLNRKLRAQNKQVLHELIFSRQEKPFILFKKHLHFSYW